MIAIERLADVFVDVADTLVEGYDLVGFLHELTLHAVEVGAATAAGVLLVDQRSRLHHVGASSEDVRLVELFQLQQDEGPCLDCFTSGDAVAVPDLGEATGRWPRFTEAALAGGFRSVHAFPLRLRDQVIGALNLFDAEPRVLSAAEQAVVQALANVATIALIHEQALTRTEVVNEQLQVALNERVVVEQAKGAVARLLGVTTDKAFEVISDLARQRGEGLSVLARRLVTDPDARSELRHAHRG